jgi:hypothetical protein
VPEHRCASRKGCSGTDIHRPRPSPTILPAQILKWLDGTTTGGRVWVTGHRYPPRARDRRSRAMQRLFYPYGSRPHRRGGRRALHNTLQECRLTTSGPPRLGFRLAGVGRCPESALSRPSSGQTAGLCRHLLFLTGLFENLPVATPKPSSAPPPSATASHRTAAKTSPPTSQPP